MFKPWWARALAVSVVWAIVSCGEDSEPGSPGDPSGGGSTSEGGSGGSGDAGDAGDGGRAGEGGGRGGSGGTSGSGGAAGEAGAAGVAGTAATGGTAGDAGAAGVGGNAGDSGQGGMGGEAGGGAGGDGSGGCVNGTRDICETTPGPHGGCFQSMRLCQNGAWGECRAIPGEMPRGGEACNGEDEDCDGEIDEDLGSFSCGLGACRVTVPACTHGNLGVCTPLEPETTVDGCNGIDDDCDGSVDENCADCVKVAPDGDDTAALANDGATPFRNVQPAIDFARTSGGTRVCVAAGSSCGAAASYAGPSGADLTMGDGVSVLADYESSAWTHCADSTTTLAPTTARGVYFPASIQRPTALDGFVIQRISAETTAGVTVDGARRVTLSNLTIENTAFADRNYGVNLVNGSEVSVVRSTITVGSAPTEVIAVRVVGARVFVEESTLQATSVTPTPGSASELAFDPAAPDEVYALRLENAPGSRVARSTLRAEHSFARPYTRFAAAVRILGDANGVVIHGNSVHGEGLGVPEAPVTRIIASAIGMTDCDDAEPWIVGNESIIGQNDMGPADGITSTGACHPVIDSNREIRTTSDYGTAVVDGAAVRCRSLSLGGDAGVASRCVVSRNPLIRGVGVPFGGSSRLATRGIDCDGGGCAKISQNGIIGHERTSLDMCTFCNVDVWGLRLRQSGAFVDRNRIEVGCSTIGFGIYAENSWSRIQNNFVRAKECDWDRYRRTDVDWVFIVVNVPNGNAVDVNSNSFMPGSYYCSNLIDNGRVRWDAPSGTLPLGTVRNNLIHGSNTCGGPTFVESSSAADPAVLEFNYFVWSQDGTYLDAGGGWWDTSDEINAMADITSAGNLAGDFDLVPDDGGTPVGAPLWDFYGNPRDDPPDVGPVETD